MPRLMPVLRAARRRGLTLPELVVAILLLAIVGGGITRVMVKQQQYYKDASRTAGARRELRLGASMLPVGSLHLELGRRHPDDERERVIMRAYIGTSIICGFNGGLHLGATEEPGQAHAHVVCHAAGCRRHGLCLQ
jgi:prepilin-type N-terminal cleavage/methylation domain-containing protein